MINKLYQKNSTKFFADDFAIFHKHNLQFTRYLTQNRRNFYNSSLKGRKERKKKEYELKKSYPREETRARAREINYTDSRQA